MAEGGEGVGSDHQLAVAAARCLVHFTSPRRGEVKRRSRIDLKLIARRASAMCNTRALF